MNKNVVCDVAHDLIALFRSDGFDPLKRRDAIQSVLAPFIGAEEDLFQYGIKRPSPPDRTRTIFYSPELILFLSRFGTDYRLPVHNHESWNALMICSGAMHFTSYRRLDKGDASGRAKLEVAEERIVKAGEIGIVDRPPHDVHQLEILMKDTWMVTVAPCPEPALREIYNTSQGTYDVKPLSPLPVAVQ